MSQLHPKHHLPHFSLILLTRAWAALASIHRWNAWPNSNTQTGMFVRKGGWVGGRGVVIRDKSLLDHLFVFAAWWSHSSDQSTCLCPSLWILVLIIVYFEMKMLLICRHFKAFSHKHAVFSNWNLSF